VKKIILLLLVMLINTKAFASPYFNKKLIIVDYVDVGSPYMTPIEKKDMMKNIIAFLRASGIKAKLGARYNIADPFVYKRLDVINTNDRFSEEFYYWKGKVSNLRKRNHVLYVISPPWTIGNKIDSSGWPNGGKLRLGGMAETGSVKKGCIANGSASAVQIGGGSLKQSSENLGRHEVSHCLGAGHDDSVINLMNKFIPSTGGPLFYTPRSLGEIAGVIK